MHAKQGSPVSCNSQMRFKANMNGLLLVVAVGGGSYTYISAPSCFVQTDPCIHLDQHIVYKSKVCG